MAKGRNNLLGVGGQRKKLSRSQAQGNGPSASDRQTIADQKLELVRKMRERTGAGPAADGTVEDSAPAED